MYEIACVVDEGIGCHGNDDRAMVCGVVISEGEYLKNSDSVFAAICDGVGGELYGDLAANAVATILAETDFSDLTISKLGEVLAKANAEVLSMQRTSPRHKKMATTVAGIYLNGEDYISFNAGDTRIYRFRPPYIAQLSTDHTLIAELKELGIETKPEQEHVITKYLGKPNVVPDVEEGKGRVFDIDSFLICSDGVTDVLSEAEIEEMMGNDCSAKEICWSFIEKAIEKGSKDNVSAIVIRRVQNG